MFGARGKRGGFVYLHHVQYALEGDYLVVMTNMLNMLASRYNNSHRGWETRCYPRRRNAFISTTKTYVRLECKQKFLKFVKEVLTFHEIKFSSFLKIQLMVQDCKTPIKLAYCTKNMHHILWDIVRTCGNIIIRRFQETISFLSPFTANSDTLTQH